jgi:2-polyprenyl-3-methyl-5-hydroxy-6-metoxy-1,4-benzoquinol methylase
MLVRLIRRILKKGASIVEDPIKYNSKENINSMNRDVGYFLKMKTNVEKTTQVIFNHMKDNGLLSNTMSVLDVGCGFGNLLNLISAQYPEASLLGTDFSESKIYHLKGIYSNIDFKVHNIYDALEGTFDLIICTEVLEHLLYPRKALVRLVEALNSNGKAFITVPNGRLDTFNGHINFWSLESWNVFLEENIAANYQIETGLTSNNKMIYTIIKK